MPDHAAIVARTTRLLGLRPGELSRTALVSLFHVGFVAAVVLVKSASNALVVARYHADALPPLYIASAVATGLAAWLVGVAERGRARRLPRLGLLVAAVLLAGLSAGVYAGLPLVVPLLYLFGETFATLASIRFWSAASELFDLRESRRAFGVFAAAGMIGAILAGLAAQLLGGRVGATGLLPFACGALLVSALVAHLVLRALPADRAASPRALAPSPRVRGHLVFERYPRALATLMILLAALTALADYVFRLRAGAELGEAELASLFGALNLWMGVIAVVFQLGAAGRVLERWGIFRYLFLTPGLSAGAAVGCLFLPGIGPAFALRLIESSGSLSLNPAAFQLLYGPIPDELRPRIRAAIDGLTKKLGFALGGALLLAIGVRASLELVVAALVAVVALIGLVLARTRTLYVGAIEARISRTAGRAEVPLRDAETRQALLGKLGDDDPVRVLTAISMLEEDPRFDPRPHLHLLLAHPHARVRMAGVRLAAARSITQAAPHLERLLDGHDPQLRYEAALALARLAPSHARRALAPLVRSEDPALSGAAIAALLPLEGERGEAAAALRERLRPGLQPEVRRETARLIGRLGPSAHAAALATYLSDPSPLVRRAACEAAGLTRDLSLVPALVDRLADRPVRSAARRALAAYGDAVVATLSAVLDDRARPLALRLEVPRVLRTIATEPAARALLFSNIQEDAYLRYRIAVNLSRLHEERPELPLDRKRAREATVRRLDWYAYNLPIYRDLEAGLPAGSPLVRALGDRLQQNLEVVFRLVQLLHSERALLSAWRRFAGGDARERSYAMELLENLLDDDLRRRVLPLLERYHRLPEAWGGVTGNPDRAPARVLELAVEEDAAVRAIARHTALRLWPDRPPLPPGAEKESEMDAAEIEKLFLLESVEIFARCDVDDLVALAAIAKEKRYRGGETIFEEGEPADALYVILEGHVSFEKSGAEVLTLGTRDSFGDSSLLDGAPRPVRAVALAPGVRVLAIDRFDFLDLISDRPELLRGIFAAVSKHLRQVIDVAASARPAVDELAAVLEQARLRREA